MYCFYMYYNVLYQLLLLPLFIRLFNYLFIHKDCLDCLFYLFEQHAFNVITEKCYVFMYLCVEITNCLLFTIFIQYSSINDFGRIGKIKIVKGFEKI